MLGFLADTSDMKALSADSDSLMLRKTNEQVLIADAQKPFDLVEVLLNEQQVLTAVDSFAQLHAKQAPPMHGEVYRDLIPLSAPQPGQQYIFEVNLDACSGCKSCVVACHNLNGLEEAENWRDVGLLVGGTSEQPLLQHITTTCHHCIEPACLIGCPVNAYDKDPITGIVRHLDDQCIGCQYCIFKCPYDVPKYSNTKGIVRKCDMCSDRLANAEAPACVQSCPHHAIRIAVADTTDIITDCEANHFLPSAPQPDYSLPTTRFNTSRALPRNALSANYFKDLPQHAHWPLVIMLVLTQLSVGSFIIHHCFPQVLRLCQANLTTISAFSTFEEELGGLTVLASLSLGLLGLIASIFHLGRPAFAFRAILGIRRSWLSREIFAFGCFAMLAVLYTIATFLMPSSFELSNSLAALTSLAGLCGLLSSLFVYVDTPRETWSSFYTGSRFTLTAVILGLPTTLLLLSILSVFSTSTDFSIVMLDFSVPVSKAILLMTSIKLISELVILMNLKQRRHTPQRRTAVLLTTKLSGVLLLRIAAAVVGGIVFPSIVLSQGAITGGNGYTPLFYLVMISLSWICLLIGELLERFLFFTSVTTQRMPGISP